MNILINDLWIDTLFNRRNRLVKLTMIKIKRLLDKLSTVGGVINHTPWILQASVPEEQLYSNNAEHFIREA